MEKMIEEFELMCKAFGISTTKITVANGGSAITGYRSDEVNEMFGVFCFAWQASRAALCVNLPRPKECDGAMVLIFDVDESLDEAGVPHK